LIWRADPAALDRRPRSTVSLVRRGVMHEHLAVLLSPLGIQIAATVLTVAVVLMLRAMLIHIVRHSERMPAEVRRRWLVQVRNVAALLIVVGVVAIWAQQLRVVALSLFAVAVAIVIASKELIQCLSGGILRSVSHSFDVGDRIEVAGLRGDVIDHNALTTTVLEIGPGNLTQQLTGRAVVLPNAVFLDKPCINEFFTHKYVLHVFKVPVAEADWKAAERDLLLAAAEVCHGFLDEARDHFLSLARSEDITIFSVEPRVSVSIPAAGQVDLVARVSVPARHKGRIEQAIVRGFLERRAATPATMAPPTTEE
jgi:small-conductance mechanosensitive channel